MNENITAAPHRLRLAEARARDMQAQRAQELVLSGVMMRTETWFTFDLVDCDLDDQTWDPDAKRPPKKLLQKGGAAVFDRRFESVDCDAFCISMQGFPGCHFCLQAFTKDSILLFLDWYLRKVIQGRRLHDTMLFFGTHAADEGVVQEFEWVDLERNRDDIMAAPFIRRARKGKDVSLLHISGCDKTMLMDMIERASDFAVESSSEEDEEDDDPSDSDEEDDASNTSGDEDGDADTRPLKKKQRTH